jgi:transposase
MAHNPKPIAHRPLKAFAQPLLGRGKHKMTVIGALMRKLLHLAFGVLKYGQPFDPNWNQKTSVSA